MNNTSGDYEPQADTKVTSSPIPTPDNFDTSKLSIIKVLLFGKSYLYDPKNEETILEIIKIRVSIIGVVVALIGAYVGFKNIESITKNSADDRINQRFVKSVEQLSSKDIFVKTSGIFSLENISEKSQEDAVTINKILDSFIRGHSSLPSQCPGNKDDKEHNNFPKTDGSYSANKLDLKSALMVGSNIQKKYPDSKIVFNSGEKIHRECIDFSEINLQKFYSPNTNFYNSSFFKTDLSGATLEKSNFNSSNLNDAILSNAKLGGAEFKVVVGRAAKFNNVTLTGVTFDIAVFKGADFENANMKGSTFKDINFENANLKKADFTEANLGDEKLRTAFISACNWEEATYYKEKDENSKYVEMLKKLKNSKIAKEINCEKWLTVPKALSSKTSESTPFPL